ncbi:MAG: hypothetical protein ACXW31_10230, partial [Thermoanaerobaculia bacterium]
MPRFTVDLDVLRHALFDRSLSQVGESLLTTKITSPLKIPGLAFTPSASFAVRVVKKDENVALLKYTLSAKTDGKFAFAPASFDASREVELSDLRVHESTDSAWAALTSDLASPRTLLDLEDVKQLKPGESLTMELGGAFQASVSFSWSDVLATHLPEILGDRFPIAVKLKSGLETKVSVNVTDHFSVVIARTDEGRFRFAVKKAAARNHAYALEVSYGVDVTAMPGIDDVLDAIFEKAPEEAMKLRGEIRKRLAAAATWKAATGFAYEYARIDEDESIAEFVLLDDTRLAEDYGLVLDGDFTRIADALREDTSSRELVKYLNETTLVRRSSFGFSLGLGKWSLKTNDESAFRQSTRTSLDGFRLITCRGTRKYDEKNVPRNDFEWTVDLKAQMKEFVAEPTSLDFDCGLHLMVSLERDAFSEADLVRMLDLAAMWNVCVPEASEFHDAIGRKVSARVQLVFDHDVLAAALAADAGIDAWAEPLAMAMPYSTFPERHSFAARRQTYADAWRAWLHGGSAAIRATSALAFLERQAAVGSFAWVSGEGHPQLRRRLDAFLTGARLLHELMTTAQAPEKIGDAYAALQQFWSQRLYIAASGRYLLARAKEAGATPNVTLQVEFADE